MSKAESEGIVVKQINPAYTSQRCSKCGYIHKDNRPHSNGQEVFGRLKCGYDIHSDYNAAKNIGLKYLRGQQPTMRRGVVIVGDRVECLQEDVDVLVFNESPGEEDVVLLVGQRAVPELFDVDAVGDDFDRFSVRVDTGGGSSLVQSILGDFFRQLVRRSIVELQRVTAPQTS